MIIGYARVSSAGQKLDVQLDKLNFAGCEKKFQEKQSGASTNKRIELKAALDHMREGDSFVVTKLELACQYRNVDIYVCSTGTGIMLAVAEGLFTDKTAR